jgi:hypothetical protein
MPKLQARAADVQASLWVLGRGGFADALGEEQWLDLSAVDLRRADLRNARLGEVDLRFAGLQRAFLAGAHLRGAYLDDSHVEGARLSAADLEGANLDGTYLQGAEADIRTKWPEGLTSDYLRPVTPSVSVQGGCRSGNLALILAPSPGSERYDHGHARRRPGGAETNHRPNPRPLAHAAQLGRLEAALRVEGPHRARTGVAGT